MKRTLMVVVLLIVAFGGSAVAAAKITGKQVKDNSVAGIDFRNGSVTGADITDGTIVAADFGDLPPGPAGEDGPRGEQGPVGPRGPDGAPALQYAFSEYVLNGTEENEHGVAKCPAGTTALGGGVSALDPTGVRVVQSARAPDDNGWFAHLYIDAETETAMYVWAVCASIR